jgi:translation initiation factor 6 (eIF-6)
MTTKIKTDLSVGVTAEIKEALEIAVAFSGIKASQYARIGLVEKLVREGFLVHPGTTRLEKAKEAVRRQPFITEAAV